MKDNLAAGLIILTGIVLVGAIISLLLMLICVVLGVW